MTSEQITYLLLVLSAFAAGLVNAMAGGGTLLTFPALMRVVDGVAANATSTVALFPGSLAGAFGYRRELWQSRHLLAWLAAPSIVGGVIGSLLVTEIPATVFESLIPWLILTAAGLFMVQGPIKRMTGWIEQREPTGRTIALVVFAQLLISIYGGYFGAGIGILMLSVLPFMGTKTIHETNAVKTVLAGLINAVSVAIFVWRGKVVWEWAIWMIPMAILGGYLGARSARAMPTSWVRAIIITVGLVLGIYYLGLQIRN
jgi:uncharacterized membrane protein YfcA